MLSAQETNWHCRRPCTKVYHLKTANGNFGGTEAPLISTLDKRGRKVLATIISAANTTFIVAKQIVSTSVRLRMLNCMMS
jgi:hypothetical protein